MEDNNDLSMEKTKEGYGGGQSRRKKSLKGFPTAVF
jgi:hypothetical protein